MSNQLDEFINTELGGCRIIEKTGSGGMGAVYRAHHIGLDKPVCVKILSPALAGDERYVQFFLREARSAAKLEHPNIVHILNVGKERGAHFIVMAFIQGENLSDIVAREGALTVNRATDIITGVLEGLSAAHEKSIIHRDIKPSNILIAEDGIPKIVDFGLARSVNEEKQLTIAGEMVGTAYFMAPEQGLGNKVDHRADLYAAGATYFYLLTARHPFEGKTSMDVVHKHISEPLPNIMLIRPDIPIWAEHVIEKLMRKKPEDRFQSAAEALGALKKERSEVPVSSAETPDRGQLLEMPSLTARLRAIQPEDVQTADRPESPEKPQAEAGPSTQHHTESQKTGLKPRGRVRIVSAKMRRVLKLALHFAMTAAAGAAFLLLGCLNTGNWKTFAEAFNSQLAADPAVTMTASTLGLGLLAWALMLKHRKLSPLYILLALSGALLFYFSGITAAAPQGTSLAERMAFALAKAAAGIPAKENMLVYAVFSFLAAAGFLSGFGVNLLNKSAGAAFTALAFIAMWQFGRIYAYPGHAPDFLIFLAGFALALAGLFTASSEIHSLFTPRPSVFIFAALAAMYVFSVSPYASYLAEEQARKKAKAAEVTIEIIPAGQSEYDRTQAQAAEAAESYKKAVKKLAADWDLRKQAWRGAVTVPLRNFMDTAAQKGSLPLMALLTLLLTNAYFLKDLVEYDEWISRMQQ